MNCEKCQDRGFIEREHGLIMEFCDCEKGRELEAKIIGQPFGEGNDSSGRIESDNRPVGSGDTSEPAKPKKPKAKKKARARAS